MKKVALIVLALVAVAAADYKPSYMTVHQHVPYYKFDWAVTADGGYGKDGPLSFGQYENREKDHTTGNWWTDLPNKGHIKVDYDVNSQVYQAYAAPSYAKPAYKPAY